MVSRGKAAVRRRVRARIRWLADQAEGGPSQAAPEMGDAWGCGRATLERGRQPCVAAGLAETLHRRPTPRTDRRRLAGHAAAPVGASTCGAPPPGRARWTWRRLAAPRGALGQVDASAHAAVRQTHKKRRANRGGSKAGGCPQRPRRHAWRRGRRGGRGPIVLTSHRGPWSAWTHRTSRGAPRCVRLGRRNRVRWPKRTGQTNA